MKTYQAIIIGSGFGGQCAALKLKENGIENFLILERRDFMGGTWCQNIYPGAAVDVQSPLYSIESEPYDWSQMFVKQDELEAYTQYVIDKNGLRNKTQTNANVNRVEWHEEDKLWQVYVQGQQAIGARFLINASGPLSTPVVPNFKGKSTFKGKSFHTNNWDQEYDYSTKRVAIIGSGASAAQVIPAIAKDVKELHVFQRTPHWVLPRPDYVFKSWQRKLLKNKVLNKALRKVIYWSLESRVIGFKYSERMLKLTAQNKALKHIKKQIPDPNLRNKVTPSYTIGCKRIILSDTLYPALCRDNVSLHDRDSGIKEITETGIITQSGEKLELDLIIYSTGYKGSHGAISFPVIGREQKSLLEFWKEYPRAYLGTSAPGFPNLFIVTGPNTGIGHTSAIVVIEAQMNYIISCIKSLAGNKNAVEVKADAENRYTQRLHKEMAKTVWKSGGCNSWYQSKSGHVVAMFPGFSFTYLRWTKNFRFEDHHFS